MRFLVSTLTSHYYPLVSVLVLPFHCHFQVSVSVLVLVLPFRCHFQASASALALVLVLPFRCHFQASASVSVSPFRCPR
jgi:hypothetical protein